jgi:magnesium transporter
MPDSAFKLPETETVIALVEEQRMQELAGLLESYHPADIAELLDELTEEQAVAVFELLPIDVASEVLDETGSLVRQELVEKVDDERLADLLDELPMDDAAEFVADLPELVAERLLDLMEPDEAEEVRELLSYQDETAGRLMITNIARLRRQWTAAQALDYLRGLEEEAELHYLYVVDEHSVLIGIVPLRQLMVAKPNVLIESLMKPDVASVQVTADQEELAEFISKYDYFSIPVVDHNGRLLGVVTVDDALDVLAEEATEDIQRMGGSQPLEQPYFAVSAFQVFRKRVGWLLLLFVASTLTGTVIAAFQGELNTVITLSLFIPLIIGTGGNAGSQTVATIIRAITLDEVRLSNIWQAISREVSIGLLLGVVMALVGFLRAVLWDTGRDVALVVALTLPAVVVWSTAMATTIPILANRIRIDPTVISGPMITTIVDATGLLIYFSLAKIILGL